MRKKTGLTGVLIITLLLSMASCKKDKALSEIILGKWEVISLTMVTYENNVKRAELIVYFNPGEMHYQFIDGGVGILYEEENDHLFSWTLSGGKIIISKLYTEDLVAEITIEDSNLSWTYRKNDDETPGISYEFIMTAKRIK
ncbi:MAG TPA: hypothetical protein PLO24_03865 [Bacteroidales bacterium]|nr:hypothetical protein [Bacteroidales bacterium]